MRSSWYFWISSGPKSRVVLQLVRQLIYTMFITILLLIITILFTFGDKKISWNIKKSRNIMTRIVVTYAWKKLPGRCKLCFSMLGIWFLKTKHDRIGRTNSNNLRIKKRIFQGSISGNFIKCCHFFYTLNNKHLLFRMKPSIPEGGKLYYLRFKIHFILTHIEMYATYLT